MAGPQTARRPRQPYPWQEVPLCAGRTQQTRPMQVRRRNIGEVGTRPQVRGMPSRTMQERQGTYSRSAEDNSWGEKQTYLRPHTSEVVAAVESLYADRLKPFGRILLKRVRECNAAIASAAMMAAGNNGVVDVDSVPLIDPKCLRRICETCDILRVEPEDGKEYSVLLLGRPRDFVDVCSPADSYPISMWEEAAAYFEELQGEDMLLPGGRYACAQVLLQRNLSFLESRSLGEVCHIVQLAVSQKRLLGYLDGNMVPFGRSVDWIKEQCAVWQQPVSFAKKVAPEMPLATWDEARACLWEILENAAMHGQPGVITLSNVKRLFRSRFNLELSETALGHSRLNELLQDVRFSDICTMELQGKSQVVVQRPMPGAANGLSYADCFPTWGSPNCTATSTVPPRQTLCFEPLPCQWMPPRVPTTAADDFVCLSTLPVKGGQDDNTSDVTTVFDSSDSRRSSVEVLSQYVHQLLELGEGQKGNALQALSAFTSQAQSTSSLRQLVRNEASSFADKPQAVGTITSRSTSEDGSLDQSSSEHGESDADAACANGLAECHLTFDGTPIVPPPGLPPPMGLLKA